MFFKNFCRIINLKIIWKLYKQQFKRQQQMSLLFYFYTLTFIALLAGYVSFFIKVKKAYYIH